MILRTFLVLALQSVLIGPLFQVATPTPTETTATQNQRPLAGKVIYFAEENGESIRFDRRARGVSRFAGILDQLGATMFTLEWNSGIPEDADLLVISGPTEGLSPEQVARLWFYVSNGGRLFIATDAFLLNAEGNIGDLNDALLPDQGIFELIWADFGIRPEREIVVIEAARVLGALNAASAEDEDDEDDESEPLPPAPILNSYITEFTTNNISPGSPITENLEGPLLVSGARAITLDATTPRFDVRLLISSDSDFFGESDFESFVDDGIAQYNIGEDSPRGAIPLAVSLEDSVSGGRIILMGDVDMITNGGGFRSSPSYSSAFIFPSNVNLAVNSVTWLLEAEAAAPLSFPDPAPTGTPTLTPTVTPTPTFTPTPTLTPTLSPAQAEAATLVATLGALEALPPDDGE